MADTLVRSALGAPAWPGKSHSALTERARRGTTRHDGSGDPAAGCPKCAGSGTPGLAPHAHGVPSSRTIAQVAFIPVRRCGDAASPRSSPSSHGDLTTQVPGSVALCACFTAMDPRLSVQHPSLFLKRGAARVNVYGSGAPGATVRITLPGLSPSCHISAGCRCQATHEVTYPGRGGRLPGRSPAAGQGSGLGQSLLYPLAYILTSTGAEAEGVGAARGPRAVHWDRELGAGEREGRALAPGATQATLLCAPPALPPPGLALNRSARCPGLLVPTVFTAPRL